MSHICGNMTHMCVILNVTHLWQYDTHVCYLQMSHICGNMTHMCGILNVTHL